ncbi:sugar isomerase domain-containing protein [Erysipelothrix sp. HDW6A]|uniref:sugar isomerase domain-containing protein n=1 Tax=Erysipelothrix sp. HDW6A TaxID=2714928 RepID=UPI001407F912|nr:sugar isomerase domain-containing protein [Erysipelothrix sp. HDW6A]QIK57879.1 sugar isomerase domain-containing protein [Erysipelothrix sp. HDW6A]
MIKNRYFKAVDELQETIRNTQSEAMSEAAAMCAEAVAAGHSIHLFDTGHIIDSEIKNRAGGFNFIRSFKYGLNVDSIARIQDDLEGDKNRSMEGLAEFALRASNVYPGDVMFIGSVSGNSISVVDLALAAQKLGVKIVALTSVTYTKQLNALHSSGKKLYEINDVLIDNCAPFGDAMLDVEGVDRAFIPASGLSAAYIMWTVMAELLDLLLEKGLKPGILGSVNYPENVQYNIDLETLYKEKGL